MATNSMSSTELLDKGITCLIEKMGVIEAERFISIIIREKSDYTKWRQRYFENTDPDAFHSEAIEFGKKVGVL